MDLDDTRSPPRDVGVAAPVVPENGTSEAVSLPQTRKGVTTADRPDLAIGPAMTPDTGVPNAAEDAESDAFLPDDMDELIDARDLERAGTRFDEV